VGLVAPGLQLLAHLLRVVGRVQAQVLLVGVRLLFFGSGARYQQSPSKVATSSFASWRLAPSTATAKGMPAPSVSMLYVSSLSWPDRWGSCRSRLVLKGPYSSPHHRWPATPTRCLRVPRTPAAPPATAPRRTPATPIPGSGHARWKSPHLPGQRVPLDARAQNVDHRGEGIAVVHSGPAALGVGGGGRDQGPDLLPKLVRHLPRFRAGHESASPPHYRQQRFASRLYTLPAMPVFG
jgi:hypothetical protein